MKTKIINDPVHGFITIEHPLLLDIVSHPWFQRLRRIRQLGLTHLVYPGAQHTRFQHSMGAMYLMSMAVDTLQRKGHDITNDEKISAMAAILLHDIGHSPFSHVLEHSIVHGISHEAVSDIIMRRINQQMGGRLDLAIDIFNNSYHKRFLNQLVSGQLDMDRLDYLKRDSFFTGVSEGVIGSDRIIKMLNLSHGEVVVEAKGIYSIEKFLVARRLMYWQVYLHKTVMVSEQMLIQILRRAKLLFQGGDDIFMPPALAFFWKNNGCDIEMLNSDEGVSNFTMIDDDDIMYAVKMWMSHKDIVLGKLATDFINRKLFKVEVQRVPFSKDRVMELKQNVAKMIGGADLADYFVVEKQLSNFAYSSGDEQINIQYSNGDVSNIIDASDMFNVAMLDSEATKYHLCYPRWGDEK